MSNDYYNTSGWPITLSFGASVSGRSEMASIAAGFDKMAALTGNGSKFIRVNAGETAQEAVTASGTGDVVLTAGATLTGATISGSGAFTTLSASGAVSGAGFTSYLASPPAIGGTAPAAGAFTTLAASGTMTPAALVDISGASAGQIKFPATQNASANANTLDDYEEGTWTPTLTFAAAGDLSATYVTQSGRYTKIGNRVFLDCLVWAGTFTYTTASGNLRVAGIPSGLEPNSTQQEIGACTVTGLSKSGYDAFFAEIYNTRNYVEVIAQAASGASRTNVTNTDAPSGSGKWVQFSLSYTKT